jgi:hypothetical protein
MKKIVIKTFLSGLCLSYAVSFCHVLSAARGHILPALGGAVFFMFTAGLMVTLASLLSALFFSALIPRARNRIFLYSAFWIFATLSLNLTSFSLTAAAHTLLIPLLVFFSIQNSLKPGLNFPKETKGAMVIFLISLAATGLWFYSKADESFFFRVRDYLLLSNKPGTALNTFYYTYSPYAAQVLKGQGPYSGLSLLCLSGLFFALPVLLYGIVFGSLYRLFRNRLKRSDMAAGLISFGLSALVLFYLMPAGPDLDEAGLREMLFSDQARMRIEALRQISMQKKNIWDYPEAVPGLSHGTIAERYWLAKALGIQKTPAGLYYLTLMAEDRSVNVQCAALGSLAATDCKTALPIFRDKIQNSGSRYVQQAAHDAYQRCR